MKHLLLILIFLTNFLSASAAEAACICPDNVVSHSQENNQSINQSTHHQESESSTSSDHRDCHHICSQCHFAALVPRHFHLKSESVLVRLSFFTANEMVRNVSQLLYRPPIS